MLCSVRFRVSCLEMKDGGLLVVNSRHPSIRFNIITIMCEAGGFLAMLSFLLNVPAAKRNCVLEFK